MTEEGCNGIPPGVLTCDLTFKNSEGLGGFMALPPIARARQPHHRS